MQRSFPRDLASLDALFEFTREAAAEFGLDEETVYAVDLSVEELFTNMVKYGGGDAEVSVGIDVSDGGLVVEMVHPGAIPFDVSTGGQVDVDLPLAGRIPGGIGLHLVRRVMDEVSYAHEHGAARITLRKHLGGH